MNKIHISIEGNVGSGKSTIIQALKTKYTLLNADEKQSTQCKIVTCAEPVEEWERHGFLKAMYTGELGHVEFQYMVLASMTSNTLEGLRNADVFIQERSLDAAFEVFAKANVKPSLSFNMLDYSYLNLKRSIIRESALTYRIYLRVTSELARERIAIRSRMSENTLSLEYLERIHEKHEEWLQKKGCKKANGEEVIVVDACRPIAEVKQNVEDIVQSILEKAGKCQDFTMI